MPFYSYKGKACAYLVDATVCEVSVGQRSSELTSSAMTGASVSTTREPLQLAFKSGPNNIKVSISIFRQTERVITEIDRYTKQTR